MYNIWFIVLCAISVLALPYDSVYENWNLNQNPGARDPTEYWGEWHNHTFNLSPKNWRIPFYTVTLDRFADGDPSNNDANGTVFEHDWMSTQFRFGGDARGLMGSLDYIQGMGMKALYLAGSPFINRPWSGDGYNPLDTTLLDPHHGTIDDWRRLIDEIHSREMFVVLDNTLGTLGDLIGFEGSINTTAPFRWDEYNFVYKSDRRYHDFQPSNAVNTSCQYPKMYGEDGNYLGNITDELHTCRDSEFDQYGDMKGVGAYPAWQTQLAKFASVQDRLRVWRPDVLDKLIAHSCNQIRMLDIDGFRMDKALQTTLDAHAEFSTEVRQCARMYGKANFLIVGEAVSEIALSALYMGRGKEPHQEEFNVTASMLSSNESDPVLYMRKWGRAPLDAAAFHYPTYGAMTRFLGLDGDIGLEGVDFVDHWTRLMQTDDMVNSNTGLFDPRHQFGVTNQDVFRWPSLRDGSHRYLLGRFITTLVMPGTPLSLWGEEQQFNVLENHADDYVFGRTPMASSLAWQLHGCYTLGEKAAYANMPFDSANFTCHDDSVSLDHRDPSHPVRNIEKRMLEIRQQYPSLNDGYSLQTMSTLIRDVFLPGSGDIPSPTGIWSIYRGRTEGIQDFSGDRLGSQGAWIVYQNENSTVDYAFDCNNSSKALISAFPADTTVKSLFYPYEEYILEQSNVTYGIEGSSEWNGCLSNFTMPKWGWNAFVPKQNWTTPAPTLTRIIPRHDARIESLEEADQPQTIPMEIQFSKPMDCDSVKNRTSFSSTTQNGQVALLNVASIDCLTVDLSRPEFSGGIATGWRFRANLTNVFEGVHTYTIRNASAQDGTFTSAVDTVMFRVGKVDNPIVFPKTANYTRGVLQRNDDGSLYVVPKAPGADKFRYSTNWGSSWSNWTRYTGQNYTLTPQPWSGTKDQEWVGEHVILNFWSEKTGSSDHVQHSDLGRDNLPPRRWPHVFAQGSWNQYGYDSGLDKVLKQDNSGLWKFNLITEWPTDLVFNVWGMNADGSRDRTAAYGDVDGDYVLDSVPPDSLSRNFVNITDPPPRPFLGYTIVVNDGTFRYHLEPLGSARAQLVVAILLACVPLTIALSGCLIYQRSFCKVKHNKTGSSSVNGRIEGFALAKRIQRAIQSANLMFKGILPASTAAAVGDQPIRTVLIATIEYEIEDWEIKVRIGGLGQMSSLMGRHLLPGRNLIWVVPCLGSIEYPFTGPGEVMTITVFGQERDITAHYHEFGSITYVLLDSPVFRARPQHDPYPKSMADFDSAVFYSAWNQCIAEVLRKFDVDIYHVNDYHGALATLYLLPHTMPICVSLHNAEFQGQWSLKSKMAIDEACKMFNLPKDVMRKYVQFEDVFNPLHAAAAYLREHQNGFGAVGVSKKYGKRAHKRYSIFWGLVNIGSLQNPDPTDKAPWDKTAVVNNNPRIDRGFEDRRGELRRQAQEWAGLEIDPNAELCLFVGRWSEQKGIDLIADVFFSILEQHPKVQLICIGPQIDLYGKFAARKLEEMVKKYPSRVCSKPVFTQIPEYLTRGAEFALIPSRDEPFGLVSVEAGRQGALGIGARVGGLGLMPGWWFPIESNSIDHMLDQFKISIKQALASTRESRETMRAISALQRFSVQEWSEDLEELHTTCIEEHQKSLKSRLSRKTSSRLWSSASADSSPLETVPSSPSPARVRDSQSKGSRPNSPVRSIAYTSLEGVDHPGVGKDYPKPENSSRRFSFSRSLQSLSVPGTFVISSFSASSSVPRRSFEDEWEDCDMSRQLSCKGITGNRKDFNMQKVDPFFNDPNKAYMTRFEEMLKDVSSKNSETNLCISRFLRKSEKSWFDTRLDVQLGRNPKKSALPVVDVCSINSGSSGTDRSGSGSDSDDLAEFELGFGFVPHKGLKKWMQVKIGSWPVYSFILAFGQILAVNSLTITLLIGDIGQNATQLYVVASVFAASSGLWWFLFRLVRSVWVLSTPFAFYGSAFFLLGISPYASSTTAQAWIGNVATGLYAFGSGSAWAFFSQNFGSEGGAPVESLIFRAWAVQGIQQIYTVVLWYWGSTLTRNTADGRLARDLIASTRTETAVAVPIALLLWGIGIVLFFGLPEFYRQKPGFTPEFFDFLRRRKLVWWFFTAVVLQNYWLSAPYGRNWGYLFSSSHAPAWSIFLLVVLFFGFVWSLILYGFAYLSHRHTWILPIFAIGLGAPRWCQILWGTSNIGAYIPWGGPVWGAVLGRGLWLWLGTLDQIQGVGYGMILLLTLGRRYVAFTLVALQIIGSATTVLARATAPDKVGPGKVFPDLTHDPREMLAEKDFWLGLTCQMVIPVGFFCFFRKEQLSKP